MSSRPTSSIVGSLTVVAVVGFLAVLGWYLGQPGYAVTRLVFFAALGGFAVLGAAGVLFERPMVAAGSACGLFLLGFWQAVLWIYVYPLCGVLLVAAVVVAKSRSPS